MLPAGADLVQPSVQRVHRVGREVRWAVEELDGFGVDRSVDAENRNFSSRNRMMGPYPVLHGVGVGFGDVVHAIQTYGASWREQQLVDALTELPRKFLKREVGSWHGNVAFETSVWSSSYRDLVFVSFVEITECWRVMLTSCSMNGLGPYRSIV
jgi:hypothetical protein